MLCLKAGLYVEQLPTLAFFWPLVAEDIVYFGLISEIPSVSLKSSSLSWLF